MSAYEQAMYDSDTGYDPSIDPPTTLEEVIEYSVWRDDQLSWAEETIANLVYLEHDMGPDRHAIYDHIMYSGESFGFDRRPWGGSVRS